jgi:hypothetical protein
LSSLVFSFLDREKAEFLQLVMDLFYGLMLWKNIGEVSFEMKVRNGSDYMVKVSFFVHLRYVL